MERQLRGKASGVRTCILVCLGTAVFVALGNAFPAARSDPGRVLGQVITGIGFLGAGVILSRDGQVLGVTSAAVIWMLAALGALIGLDHLATAMVLTLVTLGILIGVEALEHVWTRFRRDRVAQGIELLEIDKS